MKKKIIILISIVAILTIAFIANPTQTDVYFDEEKTDIQEIVHEELEVIAEEDITYTEKVNDENATQIDDEEEIEDEKIQPQDEDDEAEKTEIEEQIQGDEFIENDDAILVEKENIVTLTITCETLLNNIKEINQDKVEIIPQDGIIYTLQEVVFYDGESVFNVLQRELKKNNIHFEFVNTPGLNSAYIEGINNIYELDGGPYSGWMYKVNGVFPNYGSSQYLLETGDEIEWVYSCDLGNDVGGEMTQQMQN